MAVALLGAGITVHAQTSAKDSMRVVNLQEVQVVSTRATAKTPVAFTNIGKAELKKVNFGQDIPYLLSMTPSTLTTSDAGAGIGYTTLRVRGTDGTRINITVNGIPMNDAESHNLFWVNMPDFSSSVKDMQVQRGAGTSTNGAGAFGASVNMQTEGASMKPYAEFNGSYGSFNTHKETVKVGTGLLNNHWTFDARLYRYGRIHRPCFGGLELLLPARRLFCRKHICEAHCICRKRKNISCLGIRNKRANGKIRQTLQSLRGNVH